MSYAVVLDGWPGLGFTAELVGARPKGRLNGFKIVTPRKGARQG